MNPSESQEIQRDAIDPSEFINISDESDSDDHNQNNSRPPFIGIHMEPFEPEDPSSSDISLTNNTSSSSRRAGRPSIRFTSILKLFKKMKTDKPPEKKNFDICIIRLVKKLILDAKKGEISRKISVSIDKSNIQQRTLWINFALFCLENEIETELILEIYPDEENKSFNRGLYSRIYSCSLAREIFTKLLEIFFSNQHPSRLSKVFKFRCCNSNDHQETCNEKWSRLKEYLEMHYLSELCHFPIDVGDSLLA